MSITISQNLPIPPTLAPGQVALAQDVITLYNSLNSFIVPGSVGVFGQGFVSDTNVALTIGGTVTNDYVVSVAANKSILVLASLDWSGLTGLPGALQMRMNGGGVTDALMFTNQVANSGILFAIIGPHDASSKRPLLGFTMDGAGTWKLFTANADLPTSTTASIGFTFSNATAGTLNLRHIRIWVEG